MKAKNSIEETAKIVEQKTPDEQIDEQTEGAPDWKDDWKDIRYAPKDGTLIRLCHMYKGEIEGQAIMRWGHIQRNVLFPNTVGMWVTENGYFTWQDVVTEEGGPTHWDWLKPRKQSDLLKCLTSEEKNYMLRSFFYLPHNNFSSLHQRSTLDRLLSLSLIKEDRGLISLTPNGVILAQTLRNMRQEEIQKESEK